MKVVLDVDKLLSEGKITSDERDKLLILSAGQTHALGLTILVAFGVIAVSAGLIALLQTPTAVMGIGIALLGGGWTILKSRSETWGLLGQILLIVGALTLVGGVVAHEKGSLASLMLSVLIFGGVGVAARSALLVALAVLALSACLGARTGYWHATYAIAIREPTLTIAVFTALGIALFALSKKLEQAYAHLAIIASRTCVLLVNMGFWIGSLWGDKLASGAKIPAGFFSLVWALAILSAGTWAWRENRRWMVVVAAIFGAIHFYTQWFERLGANPATVLGGGVLLIAFALGLKRLMEVKG